MESCKKEEIKVDIIVLGFTLLGLLTAYNLKKKLSDLDIIILDITHDLDGGASKAHVSFYSRKSSSGTTESKVSLAAKELPRERIEKECVARKFLAKCAKDLNIEFPEGVMDPEPDAPGEIHVYQKINGHIIRTKENLASFNYLKFHEWFEITQFHAFCDLYVEKLFFGKPNQEEIKGTLKRFDTSSVAKIINEQVPMLHYLSQHRLWRNGRATRTLERIQQHCRQRLVKTLTQQTDDITHTCSKIVRIRKYPNKQVIVETGDDEPQFVCGLLAVAMSPDRFHEISFEPSLIDPERLKPALRCQRSSALKFSVAYNENFWRDSGYSGKIFSQKGPIIWAMEKPKLSTTGSAEKYFTLIGLLRTPENDSGKSLENDVIEQLTEIFGAEAQNVVEYREVEVNNVMVPMCGDCLAINDLIRDLAGAARLSFSPLNFYRTGDVAASVEASHLATLQIVDQLRPQASSFASLITSRYEHHLLPPLPLPVARATLTVRVALYALVAFAAYRISCSVASILVEKIIL